MQDDRKPIDPAPQGGDGEIRLYPDGPLLVRGAVRIVDAAGSELCLGPGTTALCRCGKSRRWPQCDGTHRFGPQAG